jgi:dienelactone hydrolase
MHESLKKAKRLMLAICVIAVIIAWHFLSSSSPATVSGQEWTVSDQGIVKYIVSTPHCNVSQTKEDGNSTVSRVRFDSRETQMEGLLRVPHFGTNETKSNETIRETIPGIVLLPGATVTKEKEQGLARRLADLGYASIALDQRNLGAINPQGDLQLFLKGEEPIEHMMICDALIAADILRRQPQIDPERIIYAGESNGGRFAIMACALDPAARGVLAISTCGYGTDAAIARAGGNVDKDATRFYRSIDPDCYLNMIAPRPLVIIHSRNDTVIAYDLAEQTYILGLQPKSLHTVDCRVHGYCSEMDPAIKEELAKMAN